MKKHLLTLCCALAVFLLMPSCSDTDEVRRIEGDLEFKGLDIPQVQEAIKGFWRLEKETRGVPGSSSQEDVDGYYHHDIGFKGGQVMYRSTDPRTNSAPPEWLTMDWGMRETVLGTLPFYIYRAPHVYSTGTCLIGIRGGMLVTSYCQLYEDGTYIYSYYSRMDE